MTERTVSSEMFCIFLALFTDNTTSRPQTFHAKAVFLKYSAPAGRHPCRPAGASRAERRYLALKSVSETGGTCTVPFSAFAAAFTENTASYSPFKGASAAFPHGLTATTKLPRRNTKG